MGEQLCGHRESQVVFAVCLFRVVNLCVLYPAGVGVLCDVLGAGHVLWSGLREHSRHLPLHRGRHMRHIYIVVPTFFARTL